MEDEPTLEVTDRRRVAAEEESAAPPADAGTPEQEPAGADPPAKQAAEDAGDEAPMPPMDVYSLLTTTIALLSNGAWGWMGLTPNPFTGAMEKDLPQAKVAIDTVAFLVDRVAPRLSDAEQRDLRNLLSNLRVNFVQQSQAPTGKEETP